MKVRERELKNQKQIFWLEVRHYPYE